MSPYYNICDVCMSICTFAYSYIICLDNFTTDVFFICGRVYIILFVYGSCLLILFHKFVSVVSH